MHQHIRKAHKKLKEVEEPNGLNLSRSSHLVSFCHISRALNQHKDSPFHEFWHSFRKKYLRNCHRHSVLYTRLFQY